MGASLEMTPELAEICGIHAGDGYLRNDGQRRDLDISGGFEEQEYYDSHVVLLFSNFFGLPINAKFFPSRGTYGFVPHNPSVIAFMHSVGFPYGKKSLTVRVPQIILESDEKSVIYGFLRGLFDTDGCLDFSNRTKGKYVPFKRKYHYYPRICFGTVSKQLCVGTELLLTKLGFSVQHHEYQPKYPTYGRKYYSIINGSDALREWVEKIGIKNTSKFSRYLVWKEFGFCPRKTTFKQRQQMLNKELDPNLFY